MTDKEAEDILTKHVEGLKANPCVIVDDCLYKAFNIALKALNVMRRMKEAYLADVLKTPLDIDKPMTVKIPLDPIMRNPTAEERNSTARYIDSISQPTGITIDNVQDYREPDFNVKEWLSSFNTESATVCFTEVQELKKRLEV